MTTVLTFALAAAIAAPSHASVVIRHQTRGCHAWSVNGSAYRASQKLTLGVGSSITFTDNDIMPHRLVELAGPATVVSRSSGMMARMSATTSVVFPKAGVYRFTTKPGEDYVQGVKTVGPDNVLRLTVTVTR